MKKIIIFIAVVMLSTSISTIPVNAAGGCGNFAQTSSSPARCVNEGCGFMWQNPQTNYQKSTWQKTCVNGNGKIYYEHEVRDTKLGCC